MIYFNNKELVISFAPTLEAKKKKELRRNINQTQNNVIKNELDIIGLQKSLENVDRRDIPSEEKDKLVKQLQDSIKIVNNNIAIAEAQLEAYEQCLTNL